MICKQIITRNKCLAQQNKWHAYDCRRVRSIELWHSLACKKRSTYLRRYSQGRVSCALLQDHGAACFTWLFWTSPTLHCLSFYSVIAVIIKEDDVLGFCFAPNNTLLGHQPSVNFHSGVCPPPSLKPIPQHAASFCFSRWLCTHPPHCCLSMVKRLLTLKITVETAQGLNRSSRLKKKKCFGDFLVD